MLIQLSSDIVQWDDGSVQICFPCSVGKMGFISKNEKREGDQKTPTGIYKPQAVYYRPDRVEKPLTILPTYPLHERSFWCDDVHHPLYNQYFEEDATIQSFEKMWMDRPLYDIVITTDHNTNPVVPYMGSAIFIHCTEGEDVPYRPSLGCLKLQKKDLLYVCAHITEHTQWVIPEKLRSFT